MIFYDSGGRAVPRATSQGLHHKGSRGAVQLSVHDKSVFMIRATPSYFSTIRPLLLRFHDLFFMCGAPAAPDVCLAVLGVFLLGGICLLMFGGHCVVYMG